MTYDTYFGMRISQAMREKILTLAGNDPRKMSAVARDLLDRQLKRELANTGQEGGRNEKAAGQAAR